MPNEKSEIILYHTDDLQTQIEVRVEEESVWLTQAQMVTLFDTTKQNVSLHINNIFKERELEKLATVKYSLIVQKEGNRLVQRKIEIYNLDVIISVGYRVKSQRGTQFRIWANRVLKDYLLKGYAVNQRFMNIENRLTEHEKALQKHEEKIEFFVRTALPPVEGIFFDGQIYDAFHFVENLIKSAKKSIILIDNYVDDSVLKMMSDKGKNVKVKIYTQQISQALELAQQRFNEQYGNLAITAFSFSHDRFLIIDETTIYLIGASLKDLGKKWFGFAKLDSASLPELLNRLPK